MKPQSPPQADHPYDMTRAMEPDKAHWQEPKLTFIEPTLTRHGPVQEVTEFIESFFQSFDPNF